MMQIVVLYAVTALIFLALDAIALRKMLLPLFEKHVGVLLAPAFNMVPAMLFYLVYIAGILWFVSIPALNNELPANALISGLLLGFMAYGTYEFTNYATLKNWHWHMVLVDVGWGTTLTGLAAWGGVIVARAVG